MKSDTLERITVNGVEVPLEDPLACHWRPAHVIATIMLALWLAAQVYYLVGI